MCQINWIKTFDKFDWDFVFSGLQKFKYGDKFIHIIRVALTKIQSKTEINCLLSNPLLLYTEFDRGVCPQSCYTLLQLKYLLISLIRIKGMQIGDHMIKIVDFADETIIFLRFITCFCRIEVISKLYEDAPSSKINFSRAKSYWLEDIKIELINREKWNGYNFPLKYLEIFLATLSSITPTGTK